MLHTPASLLNLDINQPPQLSEWLHCDSPITDKLHQRTGSAHLELINQEWVQTDWWAQQVLGICDAQVFQREILMKSKQHTYWFARSIIPRSCYNLDPLFFNRLQTETIKNLIYNNDKVRRIKRSIYAIDKQCLEFYWLKNHICNPAKIYWVRLSTYIFKEQKTFYLIEIMLPVLKEIN